MSFNIYTTSLSNIDGMKKKTNLKKNYNSKKVQISSKTFEIGVQISMVLPTQVSNWHLI